MKELWSREVDTLGCCQELPSHFNSMIIFKFKEPYAYILLKTYKDLMKTLMYISSKKTVCQVFKRFVYIRCSDLEKKLNK